MSKLLSIGGLAKRFNDEVWRVEYALRSRRIRPLAKVGNANVYGPVAIRQVGQALDEIHGRTNKGDAREELARA